VVQQPGSSYAYSASGTSLTLTSATSATDTMYCVYLGKAVQTVTPASNSVTNAMLTGSIDLTSKVTGTLPVANGGTNLTSGFQNGITMADQWRLTANLSGTDTIITSNLEQVDTSGQGTLGSAMTVSSGVFTFPSTGIYLILFKAATSNTAGDETQFQLFCNVTTNNSSYTEIAEIRTSARPEHNNQSAMGSTLIDVTDTSNVKVKFSTSSHQANTVLNGNTTHDETSFTFIRLGDT
jgi:hypothetical protein